MGRRKKEGKGDYWEEGKRKRKEINGTKGKKGKRD